MTLTDGEQRALVRKAPAGLIVRTETQAVGDGPYRASAISTLVVEAKRRGRSKALAYGLIGAVFMVVTVVAGDWWSVFLALAACVCAFTETQKMRRERVLAIDDEHLQLAKGARLPLADVRKLEIVQRFDHELDRDVECVVVHTRRDEVEVARVDEREQAEYVERLVDEAYRAHLRRTR